ncbi:hypothetical protein Ancab_025416, partial [Ancistrocladus abbreviatus]
FCGSPVCGPREGGGRQQPIMKQAQTPKADQVDASNGPLSPHRKTTQDISKGESGSSRSSPVVSQSKKCPNKTQTQPRKIKSLKPCLMAVRRKRKKEIGEGKSNNQGKDNTMVEEGPKDNSESNNKTWSRQKALNTQEGKKVYRKVEEHSLTGISIGDNGIQNMNWLILTNSDSMLAKKIWEASKTLGAMFEGNENELLLRIHQMEERDNIEWS